LSLLILAGAMTLWIRSCFGGEGVLWIWQRTPKQVHHWYASYGNGSISIQHDRLDSDLLITASTGWTYYKFPDTLQYRGFGFNRVVGTGEHLKTVSQIARFPLWPFLLFAIPPIIWWRRRRKTGGRGFPLVTASATGEELNHKAHQEHQEKNSIQ